MWYRKLTTILIQLAMVAAPAVVAAPVAAAAPADCAPFPDVDTSNVHCRNIAWLAEQGITKPIGGRYGPDDGVNRGAMTAFLFRLAHPGQPSPGCAARPFPDVPTDDVFCGYIAWAADNGLAFGHADGAFRPAEVVTRGAMAAFLYRVRHAGVAAPACTVQPFSDVSTTSTFCGVISWLRATGLTVGSRAGTVYEPKAPVTRASMATFLRRLADLPASGWECAAPAQRSVLAATVARYSLGPVQARAAMVAEAVGPRFGIKTVHGWRAPSGPNDTGDHPAGLALDFMISNIADGEQVGWDLVDYVQRNQTWIGVSYIIYQQQIWMAGRPYDQWREMEDRGSPTANHRDHVHLSLSADPTGVASCRGQYPQGRADDTYPREQDSDRRGDWSPRYRDR